MNEELPYYAAHLTSNENLQSIIMHPDTGDLDFLLKCVEHDQINGSGVGLWNSWRKTRATPPQLIGFDINSTKGDKWNSFRDYNFVGVNFENANLSGVFTLPKDLAGANFQNANLKGTQLDGAILSGANFQDANLEGANLSKAELEKANFKGALMRHTNLFDFSGHAESLSEANWSGGDYRDILVISRPVYYPYDSFESFFEASWKDLKKHYGHLNLKGAFLGSGDGSFRNVDFSWIDLRDTYFSGIEFDNCNFSGADLRGANFSRSTFDGCDFTKADLREADFRFSKFDQPNFSSADLSEANLSYSDFGGFGEKKAKFNNSQLIKTNFYNCNLSEADFSNANLLNSNLTCSDLSNANFNEANLEKSFLMQTNLVETNFDHANLTGCHVYGVAAWDISLNNTIQANLNISKDRSIGITVDDLEVAQFIYLLINNQKIRNVINTVTSKAVLILGRFKKERKNVLDALREELKKRDLAPIIFDFEPSQNRDLTETVQLLANMSKFVIADLTEAKSIPQELSHIIPFFPSVPVLPILLENEYEYAMFEHWNKFNSVLPIFRYKNQEHLLDNLAIEILKPIEDWKNNKDKKSQAELKLEEQYKKFEELKKTDPEQYRKLQESGIIPN